MTLDRLQILEDFIDARGMEALLEDLALIAAEKAEHIQASYQDKSTSKLWVRVSKRLEGLSNSRDIRRISP